jgi:UDP-N-acetylmuramate--alanine ligase
MAKQWDERRRAAVLRLVLVPILALRVRPAANGQGNPDLPRFPAEPVYFGGTVDRSVGSREIICEIERHGRNAFAFPDRGSCGDALVRLARGGDRIVIMGARDDSLSHFAHEVLRRIDKN